MEVQPQAPKNRIFQKNSFFEKFSRFRFQRALNHPQTLSLSQVMQENVILPKYGNSALGSQKWNFSKKFHFFEKASRFRFQRALNHLQTLSLSQVMQENVILAYYAQIWKFSPRLPKIEFFKKIHFFEKFSRFRFQRALNHPQTLSLSQVMQENVILPKYGNSALGSQKWNFSKKFHFFEKASRFRFQRALNHLQKLSLSQVMQENVISAYYAQIWKFSPRLPKIEFFKKIHFFEKFSRFRFQRALNHPQTLSLSQVMQENVILPKYGNSALGSQKWNFSKKFHFFEKASRFRFQRALNHPQTLSLSQVMQENVTLAYYAQIWKFDLNLMSGGG